MKKNKKKRIIVAILLLLLIAFAVFLGINYYSQKKATPISSESNSGISENSSADETYDFMEKEQRTDDIAIGSDESKEERKLVEESINQKSLVTKPSGLSTGSSLKVAVETERMDIISAPDIALANNPTTLNGNEGIQGYQRESETENKPELPVETEDDDVSESDGEADENLTAFEKAQNEVECQTVKDPYIYYLDLPSEKKQEIYDMAPSPSVFLKWVNDLRKEYEDKYQPSGSAVIEYE